MRTTIIILTLLILIGCKDKSQKIVSQNNRYAIVLKPDMDLRKKYEQQIQDTIFTDTTYNEYLGKKLKPIRENFKKINEIKEWTAIDNRKLNEFTEGGAATYYFLKDSLLKIVASHFGETGKTIEEYYTQGGKLSFVFEKTYHYNRPITYDSIAMKENNDTEVFDINKSEIVEDQSYFENGVLIRQINNQDCGSPFKQPYLQKEQVRLQTEFGKLLKLLKN
jgi:hypothetical protein